jgi:hypothetical protein
VKGGDQEVCQKPPGWVVNTGSDIDPEWGGNPYISAPPMWFRLTCFNLLHFRLVQIEKGWFGQAGLDYV